MFGNFNIRSLISKETKCKNAPPSSFSPAHEKRISEIDRQIARCRSLSPPKRSKFCEWCLEGPVTKYCDGRVVLEKPCTIHKADSSPTLEILPREQDALDQLITTTADKEARLKRPPLQVTRLHTGGCLYSENEEFIVQGSEGLAESIFFRRCFTGKFVNACGEVLENLTWEKAGRSVD